MLPCDAVRLTLLASQSKISCGFKSIVEAIHAATLWKDNPPFLEALPQKTLETTIRDNLLKKAVVAR